MSEIRKAAVLGAGVMGAGIAAHVANAGVPVLLLDIVPKGANDRNALAADALRRMAKAKPAAFMHKDGARLVTPGNLEDHLGGLADCDWICEAVIEDPTIKRRLYEQVEKVRKDGSIVTTNTSTIPLGTLIEGLPERFRRDFAVTHFFNPPRYMRLLELVGGAATRAEALTTLRDFADRRLGKDVVAANDTPGFIANRIGIYWSTVAMTEALRLGLTVEEADSIVGRPMGVPKTGIFGLADLTGIDLAPHINASMLRLLPKRDAFVREFDPAGPLAGLIADMLAKGRAGRKSGQGFYRRREENGAQVREALDLTTREYRPLSKARLASAKAGKAGLRVLCEHPDRGGQYAWAVLSRTLCYAAELAPEIAQDLEAIDRAMRAGYAWKQGPFQQLDMLGADWFVARLQVDGRPVPALVAKAAGRSFYREADATRSVLGFAGGYVERRPPEDAWRLADKKRGRQPIQRNGSASLWDVGDGVTCLELHSKMNSIDADTIAMLMQAAQIERKGFKALIIGGDADNFSVGANVGVALFAANAAMWPLIEQTVSSLQQALMGLKYAKFPSVAAVAGMALGGGLEIALHCSAIVAHAESYMGLVEAGVGLIPAGGGSKELLTRCWTLAKRPGGPMPAINQAFETIALAKVSTSAAEARDLAFLRASDDIVMNRDRLLAEAKARALALAGDYKPPEPVAMRLPGPTAKTALRLAVDGFLAQGKATPHDARVAAELADVLAGGEKADITGEVTEKALLELERKAFLALIRTGPTLDRIEHLLETGRPLRN
ncbi:MAG: 3-hydroxyacyl-CoA dehydrogenase/enoyl-CoA hydratase family protein [Alphaproteobacteria bacterium]|nr:3-hydroxyacyl-CoA dehydrogenase/enoyl-CoA hydratase family protein [Alphaproteobacteria bacterium]